MFDRSSASRILVFIGKNGRNRWCAALSLYRSRDRFRNDFDSILALKIAPKSLQNQSRKAFNFVLIFRCLPTPEKINFGSQLAPQDGPKLGQKSNKKPSKIDPTRIRKWNRLRKRFLKLQMRFRIHFGRPKIHFRSPRARFRAPYLMIFGTIFGENDVYRWR